MEIGLISTPQAVAGQPCAAGMAGWRKDWMTVRGALSEASVRTGAELRASLDYRDVERETKDGRVPRGARRTETGRI